MKEVITSRILRTILLVITICLFSFPAHAKYGGGTQSEDILDHSSLHMVGQVGGRTEDVAVQGDYAYVAVGLRLVVLDVSQPKTPTEIGSTTPFPQFVAGVTISGTLACVADGMAGLRLVDVSNPSAPVEVGVYDTPGYAEHVALAGQYAYIADSHYGLRIVDVSNPAQPAEVGYAYPLNYIFDVAVDGQYAYLAAAGAGLLVVDVSDPTHPMEVGAYDTPGYAYGVDAAGDVVYVADGWEGLRMVNVSNPAQPVEVGAYDTPGWAFGVDVVDSRAYAADASGGLRVVDVSDPAHPTSLGGYEVARGHAGRVAVAGNTAYVADRNWGLRVVNVSDPGAPTQVGIYSPLGYAVAVAVSGDYAYVAAATYGLRVVDISDPAHPVELGAYDTQGYATGVGVVGNYAYLAVIGTDVGAGLHVVDVSDPAHPVRVGYSEPRGTYWDIVVAGGIAYIANERGLELIDISSPYTPTEAGYINLYADGLKADTSGVDISGTLAYVVGWGGLYIVDVSNPVSPTLINNFKDPDWGKGFDVDVAGTTAYVTHHGGDALKIIDISDPLHPALLGVYNRPGEPQRVIVVNSIAYVASSSAGLYAIDVADPLNPTLAFSYDTPGFAMALAVVSNYIYVADGQGGLLVLETREAQSEAVGPMWREPLFAENVQSDGLPSWPPMSSSGRRTSPVYHDNNTPDPVHRQLPQPQPDVQLTASPPRISNTCVVTSTANSGPGTLRECMENAISGDIITFDPVVFPPTSPATIALTSKLPGLSQGSITIDASNAGVILDGSQIEDGAGLNVRSSDNVIWGLQILHFPSPGIVVEMEDLGANNNTIGGDRTIGSGPMGQGNLISGNGGGVEIIGNSNKVVGNFIGTDVSGLRAFGNERNGVVIHNCYSNTIGGTSPGERNVISANGKYGVRSAGKHAADNVIVNNYIGTDVNGIIDLGNERDGVSLDGCRHNVVKRNLISANGRYGVHLAKHAADNVIVNNYIGTDVNGMVDLGNERDGVLMELGAAHNVVKGNLISGNNWGGIGIANWGSSYNTVVGNLIGTDASGMLPLGNRWPGVGVGFGGANFNRIGGTSPGDGNVISGNSGGIELQGTGNLVLGNLVGTNISGTEAIRNTSNGIYMVNSSHNFIGGTTTAERNVISGNGKYGISLSGSEHIVILNNYIGTDASGTVALANHRSGIQTGGAKYTVTQGNLIAGNERAGISIGNLSDFSHVRANYIGIAADGASPLPNGMIGVSIEAASSTVGGSYPEDGNIIAFNSSVGVQVWTYSGNTIRRNSIYGNASPGIYLGDGGNNLLAAPVITDVLPGSVSGTACPGCIVEIFSDEEDQGQVYEGSVTVDGQGNWTWIGSPSGPYVTATATDGTGNTSPFSNPKMAW